MNEDENNVSAPSEPETSEENLQIQYIDEEAARTTKDGPEEVKNDGPEEPMEDGLGAIRSTLAEMSKGKQMKAMAKNLIISTKPILLRLKERGVEMPQEIGLFKEGVLAVRNSDYLRGSQLIARVKKMLENKEDQYLHGEALAALEDVEAKIKDAQDVGLDTSGDVAEIQEARKYLEQGLIEECNKMTGTLKGVLEQKIEDVILNKKRGEIEEARVAIRNFEALEEGEVSLLMEQVHGADGALGEKNYSGVDTFLVTFREKYDELEKIHLKSGILQKMARLGETISLLGEVEIDVTDGEEIVKEISALVESNELIQVEPKMQELEKIVEHGKNEKARRMAGKFLARGKELFQKLNKTDVDISGPKAIFQNSILAIKSQNFLKGCLLLKECISSFNVLEEDYLGGILQKNYQDAMEFYSEFLEMNFFTDDFRTEVKELLDQVGLSLSEKKMDVSRAKWNEYLETKEIIDEKINSHKVAETLVEDVVKLRKVAEELSVDISAITPVIDTAMEYLDDFIFDEAIMGMTKAKELLESRVMEHRRESARMMVENARQGIEEMGDIHPELESLGSKLEQAVKFLEDEEFDASEELSKDILQSVEVQKIREKEVQVGDLFGSIQQFIDECEAMGMELLRPQALLYKAKLANESGSFDRALELAQNAQKLAIQGKEDFLMKQARESMDLLEGGIRRALSIDVNVQEVEDVLKDATIDFEQQKFVSAREKCKKVIMPLEENIQLRLKELVLEKSGVMSKKLRLARDIGLDMSAEKESLKAISVLKKEKKYSEVVDILDSSGKVIEGKLNDHYRDKTSKKMELERQKLDAMATDGSESQEAEAIFQKASKLMEEGNYDSSLLALEELDDYIENTRLTMRKTGFASKLKEAEELLGQIVVVMGPEANLDKPRENLSKASKELELENFDRVEELVRLANTRGDRVYYQFVIDTLLVAYDNLSEVRKMGAQVEDAQERFAESKQFLEKKDYLKAIEGARAVEELIRLAKLNFMKEEVAKNKRVVGSVCKKLSAKGMDVTLLEEALAAVDLNEGEENIPARFEESKKAKSLASKFRDDYKRSTVTKGLDGAMELVQKIDVMGVDNTAVKDELVKATHLLSDKKYSEAMKIIRTNQQKLERRFKEENHLLLSRLIEDTRGHIDKLSGRTDLSPATAILDEAIQALSEDDYVKCRELVDVSRAKADKLSHTSLLMEAVNVLSNTGDIVNLAENDGLDVEEMRSKLMNASDAFETKDYQHAIDICADIGAWMEKQRSDKLSTEAKTSLQEVKTLIEGAKKMKADIKSSFKDYKAAMQEYKSNNYAQSIELVGNIRKDVLHQKDIRAVQAIAESVSLKIEEMQEQGVDVNEAVEMMKGVESAMESGEMDVARSIIKDSIEVAMTARDASQMESNINKVRDYIAFALKNESFQRDYLNQSLVLEEGKCSKCGKEVPENAIFCLWCGNPL